MLALVECVRTGGYHAEKGRFTTYITPFLDGAMRRHLECSMGTLALDRDSMSLVRKVQSLHHRDGKEIGEICELLGVSYHAAARAIAYPTHFFSVNDLQSPEDDGDVFEWFASSQLSRISRRRCDPCGDYGVPARRVPAAFQEGAGHPWPVLRCVRPSQDGFAGDRCAKPDERVRRRESQGSGVEAFTGPVPG